MLALAGMIAVIALLLVFPDTPIGGWLRWALVEAPARSLNRLPRGKAAFYLALVLLGLLLILLFEFEGARLFGLLLPDTLVWFVMFDVGVFVDALLIISAILATNGLRVLRSKMSMVQTQFIAALTSRRLARARRAAARRPRPDSTDDDRPAWVQPGYLAFSIA